MKRRLCVVSGGRADFGLLRWTLEEIKNDKDVDLRLIATGSHLLEEFGFSIDEIESAGFGVDATVDIVDASDSAIGVARAIGRGVAKLAEVFNQIRPDVVLVLGDRYESFAATVAATTLHIPIAHCHGGERTEGAIDEVFRHSMTKLAHLHFTATAEYKKRVIQLGERPERVFNVGSLGVEAISRLPRLSRQQLETKLGQELNKKTLLVTYHPETHSSGHNQQTLANLCECLNTLNEVKIIFTLSNADEEGRLVNKLINEYVEKNPDRAAVFANLGQEVLFSLMDNVDGIVGNSSSGIIEAPSLKVGTLNIGDRQKGRIRADSIIDCAARRDEIARGLEILFSEDFKKRVKRVLNPYEGHDPSKRVKDILKTYPLDGLLRKSFYDISENGNSDE